VTGGFFFALILASAISYCFLMLFAPAELYDCLIYLTAAGAFALVKGRTRMSITCIEEFLCNERVITLVW
jgi:hypothetical protein